MVAEKIILTNRQGFHMRPASVFAGAMSKYDSSVTILFGGKEIDGKSLMNIIAACIKCGSEIEIRCDGSDETAALREATALIASGLGE